MANHVVPYRDRAACWAGALTLAAQAMRSTTHDIAGFRYRHALTLARLAGMSKHALARYARSNRP
jgi:hypothetical protein